MRKTQTRIAGAIAALLAAAVAGYSLRPTHRASTVLAARQGEVKTEVIRRTIHIVRHQKARPARRPLAAGGRAPSVSGSAVAPRTSTSHLSSVGGTSAVAGVTTRSSRAGSGLAGTAGAPVTTRTSAGHTSSGSGGTVTTRSSTGSHSVTTRSSGGGEHEGGDGGD